MYKVVIFATLLAVVRAGYLGGAVAPVAAYAAPVAHYSAAPAVSSSYIHQSHAPAVAAVHAAPALAYGHAAPALAYSHAAPAVAYGHAAPAIAYGAAPALAYGHAAPALAYGHAAPALAYGHALGNPSIGASHQSVLRSLGGNQAVSHYSKAVDSAFSSVRKFDTRITNDALAVAPVAAYAHAAPAIATSYATHAAPLGIAHASPLGYAGYAHAAPVIAKTAAVAYSPAAVVSHATFSGLGAHYAW